MAGLRAPCARGEGMTPYYSHRGITIYHGDCLDIMPCLAAASVGLVMTDLPYGMTDCSWDAGKVPFSKLWPLWWRVLIAGRAIVLTASQPFTSDVVASSRQEFKHEWIWEKNAGSNFGAVKFQPMKEHESVLVFGRGKVLYHPIMEARSASGLARVKTVVNYNTSAEVYASGGLTGQASSKRPDERYPRSLQKFNRERGLHPTQKPVDLMAYMIRTYTNPSDVVLDCCMGSGSTLVAALRTTRAAIGIEIEERYCEIAAKRLSHKTFDLTAVEQHL